MRPARAASADWAAEAVAGAPALLTAKEASEILRLDVSTVRAMQRAGELPHVTIGTRRMVPRAVLADWLRARGPAHVDNAASRLVD